MLNPDRNLADVLVLVAASDEPATRKRDMASAIRRVAKALGGTPEQVPLELKFLRPRLDRIEPESLGVTRQSWNNTRSLLNRALELATEMMPSAQRTPISPDWQALLEPLTLRDRHSLAALFRFLSARDVRLAKVTLADLETFRVAITENRLRAKPESTWDNLVWCWNRLAKKMEGWPQIIIPRENKRIVYIQPWTAFPDSFKADVDDYIEFLSGDVLNEDGPKRPLRPASLADCQYLMRSAASALVAMGRPAEEIRSIADIARLEPMKLILEHILHRGGTEHRTGAFLMARTLKAAAKFRAKVDGAELAKISGIIGRLAPKQGGLTRKNRERLMPFNDPDVVHRFLALPQRMVDEIKKRNRKTVVDAVNAQIAVAIAILQAAPMRISNLVGLDLDRHLMAIGNRVYVVLPAEEVKNEQPLQFELPDDTADLLSWYCVEYRPLLVATPTSALFPSRYGEQKERDHFGTQITRRVQKYLGLPINPHLFRHLAAKIYLDRHPGAYGLICRLLGHKSVATTMAFYSGTETASATRHFQNHIRDLRANSPKTARRRRLT